MTVCVAALCTWPDNGTRMIVGASDRMLSAPDIKFEPPQMKIYQFTPNIVALCAGDPYAQIGICYEVSRAIDARTGTPKAANTVDAIAKLYGEAFSKHRRERAETRYLKPLGLDVNELVMRQSEFDPEFVSGVTSDLRHLPLDIETIIVGNDDSGHHLYIVDDPGDVRCADAIAFAAIGSGKSHAESQFMMARHTKQTPFHTALLQTYAAKKRAEVTPTVGGETDLFFIGAERFKLVHEELGRAVDRTFRALEEVSAEARDRADQQVRQYLIRHLSGDPEADKTSNTDKSQKAETITKPRKSRRSNTTKT